MRSRLWRAAGITVALSILLQRGELSCGVFAGEWTSEKAACYASGPAQAGKYSLWNASPKSGWSYSTSATATPTGGESRVDAYAYVDTKDFRKNEQQSAIAEPPTKAWAKGSLKKVHGMPAHALGIPLGNYRASARLALEFSAESTAEGPTASVAGSGDANASCGVGNTANIGLGGINIACDSKVSKNWGFSVTAPSNVKVIGGWSIGVNAYKSEIGRFKEAKSVLYLYKIPEMQSTLSTLQFDWECNAFAAIKAFATPGWLAASKSEAKISVKSTVSDIIFEVDHAEEKKSNSDSDSN